MQWGWILMDRLLPVSSFFWKAVITLFFSAILVSLQQSVVAQQLSDSQFKGKKLFLQRCSMCHMPAPSQQLDPDLPTYGPKLEGFIRDTATESRARSAIVNGTQRMPGFKYGLTEREIDQIVGYLKIFKLSDFIRPGEEVGGGPDEIIPVTDRTRPIEEPED